MIRITVTRVEDSGPRAETDLGELRFAELGAAPAAYRETAEGAAIMRDVRAALACLAPESLSSIRGTAILMSRRPQRGAPWE